MEFGHPPSWMPSLLAPFRFAICTLTYKLNQSLCGWGPSFGLILKLPPSLSIHTYNNLPTLLYVKSINAVADWVHTILVNAKYTASCKLPLYVSNSPISVIEAPNLAALKLLATLLFCPSLLVQNTQLFDFISDILVIARLQLWIFVAIWCISNLEWILTIVFTCDYSSFVWNTEALLHSSLSSEILPVCLALSLGEHVSSNIVKMMLTSSVPSRPASNFMSASQIRTLALTRQSMKPSLTNYAPSLHLRRQFSALNPSTNISTSQKSSRLYHGVRLNCKCCALQDKSSEVWETVTKIDDNSSSAEQVANSVTVSPRKQNGAVTSEEENGSLLKLTERTQEASPMHVVGTAKEPSVKQLWIAKTEGRVERVSIVSFQCSSKTSIKSRLNCP